MHEKVLYRNYINLISLIIFAQGENDNWYFGNYAINFSLRHQLYLPAK
jgi:hypothetical protein